LLNVLTHTLIHAAQTIPGVQRLEEGIAAYEHGEYDEAIFKLEMAVYQIEAEDKDKLWDAHFYLGLSFCLTGDNDESRKQFIEAQKISKNRLPDSDIHSPKIVKLFKEALKIKQKEEWKDPITGMEFVFVKGGCYEMGDIFGDGLSSEKPVHEVCLEDFYLGKYEVTQGQWEEVMGYNGLGFSDH
jgi:formylglycine-generating enzyme required for sulfatase activity